MGRKPRRGINREPKVTTRGVNVKGIKTLATLNLVEMATCFENGFSFQLCKIVLSWIVLRDWSPTVALKRAVSHEIIFPGEKIDLMTSCDDFYVSILLKLVLCQSLIFGMFKSSLEQKWLFTGHFPSFRWYSCIILWKSVLFQMVICECGESHLIKLAFMLIMILMYK